MTLAFSPGPALSRGRNGHGLEGVAKRGVFLAALSLTPGCVTVTALSPEPSPPTASPKPPATPDVFAGLPPDPGEAGKRTLAGIDADEDGVRDDVQRWIHQNLADSEKARLATLQVAKYMQGSLVSVDDKEKSIEQTKHMMRGLTCMSIVMSPERKSRIVASLEALMSNTKERTTASAKADRHFSGSSFGYSTRDAESMCEFDLDATKN